MPGELKRFGEGKKIPDSPSLRLLRETRKWGMQGCIKWGNVTSESCLQGLPVQLSQEVEDCGIHKGPPRGVESVVAVAIRCDFESEFCC